MHVIQLSNMMFQTYWLHRSRWGILE